MFAVLPLVLVSILKTKESSCDPDPKKYLIETIDGAPAPRPESSAGQLFMFMYVLFAVLLLLLFFMNVKVFSFLCSRCCYSYFNVYYVDVIHVVVKLTMYICN